MDSTVNKSDLTYSPVLTLESLCESGIKSEFDGRSVKLIRSERERNRRNELSTQLGELKTLLVSHGFFHNKDFSKISERECIELTTAVLDRENLAQKKNIDKGSKKTSTNPKDESLSVSGHHNLDEKKRRTILKKKYQNLDGVLRNLLGENCHGTKDGKATKKSILMCAISCIENPGDEGALNARFSHLRVGEIGHKETITDNGYESDGSLLEGDSLFCLEKMNQSDSEMDFSDSPEESERLCHENHVNSPSLFIPEESRYGVRDFLLSSSPLSAGSDYSKNMDPFKKAFEKAYEEVTTQKEGCESGLKYGFNLAEKQSRTVLSDMLLIEAGKL